MGSSCQSDTTGSRNFASHGYGLILTILVAIIFPMSSGDRGHPPRIQPRFEGNLWSRSKLQHHWNTSLQQRLWTRASTVQPRHPCT